MHTEKILATLLEFFGEFRRRKETKRNYALVFWVIVVCFLLVQTRLFVRDYWTYKVQMYERQERI
jgi:cytochrome c-type biogenesis protein CcmH/NrfF